MPRILIIGFYGISKRVADEQLRERLNAFGAVLIEGPKWCGKTTTAQQAAASYIKLQDTRMRAQYLATAEANPSLYGHTDNFRSTIKCAIVKILCV